MTTATAPSALSSPRLTVAEMLELEPHIVQVSLTSLEQHREGNTTLTYADCQPAR